MGYTTEFEGQFKLNKPLLPIHRFHLKEFANARHEGEAFPGLYCQWVPNDEGTAIVWDGNEKFYKYTNWLHYLIANYISPWGYKLRGTITFQGEDINDRGKISVRDNIITTKRLE